MPFTMNDCVSDDKNDRQWRNIQYIEASNGKRTKRSNSAGDSYRRECASPRFASIFNRQAFEPRRLPAEAEAPRVPGDSKSRNPKWVISKHLASRSAKYKVAPRSFCPLEVAVAAVLPDGSNHGEGPCLWGFSRVGRGTGGAVEEEVNAGPAR